MNVSRQEKEAAQAALIAGLRQGMSVNDACVKANRTRKAYEQWRATDRQFALAADEARAAARRDAADLMPTHDSDGAVMSFAEFSEKFLGNRVWPHAQNMVDIVEGREPAHLHDAMIYEPGSMGNRRVLINIPPNHAKTMTLSVGYVTYRVVMDPNINVLIISKTQEFAKKILYAIKQRLTHPRWAALQARFGPADGYKATADMWTANKIYLGAAARDSDSKDPTIEATSIGGQIYGARASLVLLDDTITLSNAGAYENQSDWIRQEVASRLGPGGQIIVVGTRVASVDLYRHLREPDHYTDGVVPWTYLAMPAVLEYGSGSGDWQTLWPVSDEPFVETDEPVATGVFPRWTGPRLSTVRNEVGPRKWSLVYQQADVAEDATFDPVCVRGSVNPNRNHGPLSDRAGWHIVMGVDPAIAGQMAVSVVAGSRETGHFKLLTMETLTNPTPAQIRELLVETARKYEPHECLIEDNAFQGFLAQDEALSLALANMGVLLKSHHTGATKTDPDFGVASMSALFGTRTNPGPGVSARHQKDNTIELCNSNYNPVKSLIEELVAWNPDQPVKRRRQDCVMALWFAVKRLREYGVGAPKGRNMSHFAKGSTFTSARSRSRQMVVDLSAWAEERRGA